jgi:hypothetical protein
MRSAQSTVRPPPTGSPPPPLCHALTSTRTVAIAAIMPDGSVIPCSMRAARKADRYRSTVAGSPSTPRCRWATDQCQLRRTSWSCSSTQTAAKGPSACTPPPLPAPPRAQVQRAGARYGGVRIRRCGRRRSAPQPIRAAVDRQSRSARLPTDSESETDSRLVDRSDSAVHHR